MALLDQPDVLPEAMRFLVRALLAQPKGTCDQEELLALVAPDGLVEAMASIGAGGDDTSDDGDDLKTGGNIIASRSLTALRRLRFVPEEGPTLTAMPPITTRWSKPSDVSAPAFSAALREVIWELADETAPLGDAQGVMDLVSAVRLLVTAPDPLTPFDTFDSTKAGRRFVEYQQERVGTDDISKWPVSNPPQWLPFRRFAPYLGLARPVGTTGLVAECSVALRDGLADLPPATYDIATFVSECGRVVPVLDGGVLYVGDGDPEDLSPGLSMSLRQLEAEGALRLQQESDIGTRVLALGVEPGLRKSVSHVDWLGVGGKARRKS